MAKKKTVTLTADDLNTICLHPRSREPMAWSEDDPETTVHKALVEVCATSWRGDENMSGTKKAQLARLALKLCDPITGDPPAGGVVLTVDDVAMLKERCGARFHPAVVGAVFRLLDPNAEPEEEAIVEAPAREPVPS